MLNISDSKGIRTIQLAHGKVSAMDLELCEALIHALDEAAESSAVILTGSGSSFSAGVDLFRMLKEGGPYIDRFVPALDEVLLKLFTFPKPVIAAVNGHAIAGGCLLAAACDRRIAADGSGRIGVPELHVGVPFPVVAIEILRHAVPNHHFEEVVFTGQTWKPHDAHARGLVDAVVEPDALLEQATQAATHLAGVPGETFVISKLQARRPALEAMKDRASDTEQIMKVWKDPETHAFIRAYLEKTVGKK